MKERTNDAEEKKLSSIEPFQINKPQKCKKKKKRKKHTKKKRQDVELNADRDFDESFMPFDKQMGDEEKVSRTKKTKHKKEKNPDIELGAKQNKLYYKGGTFCDGVLDSATFGMLPLCARNNTMPQNMGTHMNIYKKMRQFVSLAANDKIAIDKYIIDGEWQTYFQHWINTVARQQLIKQQINEQQPLIDQYHKECIMENEVVIPVTSDQMLINLSHQFVHQSAPNTKFSKEEFRGLVVVQSSGIKHPHPIKKITKIYGIIFSLLITYVLSKFIKLI